MKWQPILEKWAQAFVPTKSPASADELAHRRQWLKDFLTDILANDPSEQIRKLGEQALGLVDKMPSGKASIFSSLDLMLFLLIEHCRDEDKQETES